MTDERIIEVLVKAEGYVIQGRHEGYMIVSHPDAKGVCRSCPDYLNSHDAIQPLIDGLTIDQLEKFDLLMNRLGYTAEAPTPLFWKASPRQKAEALARTLMGEK